MSTRAPEHERAPVRVPPAGGAPSAPGPSRSGRAWIAVIAALVIGGLIGYAIGWYFAPTETETVTRTVTETVAPPAYTTADQVEALVTFDGTNCMYAGPAEVNARTQVTFAYTATVRGSTGIIWKAAPGTTYEQVMRSVERRVDEPPPFLDYYETTTPVDGLQQTVSMSLIEGTYVVSCATNPDTSTGDVFASTMIRVVPG